MSELYIVGLDLSLTSTGVAVISDTGRVSVSRLKTKLTGHERLRWIWHEIAALTMPEESWRSLVAIEGPSYGSQHGHEHERAGLWWLVTHGLWLSGVPYAVIPPTTLKRYATGKGNASKDAVLAAVVRRYPDVEVTGNDEADALVLAAMTADHLGHPIAPVPATHSAALKSVTWPELKEQ